MTAAAVRRDASAATVFVLAVSSPLAPFRRALSSAALAALEIPADSDVALQIRVPEAGRGDLAVPCFDLARAAGLAPPEAASKLG